MTEVKKGEEKANCDENGKKPEKKSSKSAPEVKNSSEELEKQLDEANKKAAEHYDQLLRQKAEMDNLRKRTARELEDAHKFALDRFIKELLPVCDSLELGIQAASEENADSVTIREGAELTLQAFMKVLENSGVATIDPKKGDKLDPDYHQVMTMQEDGEIPPNTILTVIQKGYSLNERLVRPAMVIVAKAIPEPEPEPEPEPDTEPVSSDADKTTQKSGYEKDDEAGSNIDEKA